jgi:N-acetylated-alpha-linked acidic dipeptidase
MPISAPQRGLTLLAALAFAFPIRSAETNPLLDGYSASASQTEREWEKKFRAIPSSERQQEYMRRLTAHPHHVGSPYDKDNAEWLLKQFQEWGFDAHIEPFDVLFPTPKERKLEMTAPVKYRAKLEEPPLAIDPTSGQTREQLPTYNAYGADGDVTGPLVYANYGMPDDYEELERLGVSVKGAIVITRYGHGWRGVKVKLAAEHGALGCLIYSDPGDDGYSRGETYPQGPFRPSQGVQRGSVMDTDYPGDPLTPGKPSIPGTPRLALKDSTTIQKIPVLPISYGDAQPLLAEIRGRVAPRGWRGSLPLTYRIGPGPAIVHMKVLSNWDQSRIYDVIARLEGGDMRDEWVIRGNHHDAWVNGAEDPISGQVALLEEARAFGELKKQGWTPRRTLIYCAWDGEEPGLLGSTEWVEAHEQELKDHAVAYFNSDTNGRGFLGVDASHVLEKFINGVARDIHDPETDLTLWKRLQGSTIAEAHTPEEKNEARQRADLRVGALGDGSDYAPFMDHIGIPSADIGFGGETEGGIYHSIYDDFYWYTHYGDPGFVYCRLLSQTMGTLVMRMADAELLPLDFTDFTDTVRTYISNLQKLVKNQQDLLRERNREVEEGTFKAVDDPTKPLKPPPVRTMPPFFNFAPLENAIEALNRSADAYAAQIAKLRNASAWPDSATLDRVNHLLMQSSLALTDPEGLPGRPWFKNQIYAPGAYTGYEAKPLPGVLEAMDRKEWDLAQSQVPRAAAALTREAGVIDQATAALTHTAAQP